MAPSKNRHAVAKSLLRLACAVIVLSVGRSAQAEPPHLETPPDLADCPSANDLRTWITSQLGRDDFERSDSPSVNVRVRKTTDGALTADVSITTSMTSTRTIDDADSCVDLVRAAALSVALAIEKDAAREKSPLPAPPPSSPPMERGAPLATSIRDDRLVITASGIASVGLLPQPSTGLGGAARLRVSDSIWISGRGVWLPEAAMPNESFRMNFATGAAGGCVEPFGSHYATMVGCAHLVAGAFGITRGSVDMQDTAPKPYVGASLSAGARARVYGPVHVEGTVDGQLPFTRPTYLTTTCPPTGFQPPFMALALWLGAGISIR